MAQTDLDVASNPARASTDDELSERVRAKLAIVFSNIPAIEVKARLGVVMLSGQIRDWAQGRAASLIAHRVDGVTNVVNKLTIGRSPFMSLVPARAPSALRPRVAMPRRARPTTETAAPSPEPAG